MTIREWYAENYDKYDSHKSAVDACVKETKRGRDSVLNKFARIQREGAVRQVEPTNEASRPTRAIAAREFFRQMDYPARLRDGVKKHLGDAFLPEQDFRQLVGLDSTRFRRAADMPEFEANKTKRDGTVYWSNSDNIKKVKEMEAAI